MLARAQRLTSGRGFADTIRRGRRAGTSTVVLHLSTDSKAEGAPPRVGLVVGKAVGNAVARNQVKRRLRHVARERLTSVPDGTVLVVRALPPAAAGSSAVLAKDFEAALRRLVGPRG